MKNYDSLVIEVTRKCNFACGHCLRGEAQNIDFNPENLRKFLRQQKQDYFMSLTLTGGEPFLKPNILEKIIDIFEEEKVAIGSFYIATNGSMFNKKAFRFMKRISEFVEDLDCSTIEISNSEWHKQERSRLGLSKYVYDSMEDLLYEKMHVIKDIDFNFNDLMLIKDRRRYNHMIKEGRSVMGDLPSKNYSMIYLNAVGEVIENYCDLSFKSQTKHKKRKFYKEAS